MSVFVQNGPPFSKPVFILAIFLVSLALISICLVVSGCTTTAPVVLGFYITSMSYNMNSSNVNASALRVSGLEQVLEADNQSSTTFQSLRVGYRGVCVLYNSTDEASAEWDCSTHTGHFGNLGGDPLDLVSVAEIYRNKISFSVPLWCSVAFLGVTWLTIFPNLLPFDVPYIVRQIAAMSICAATLLLLGAMVLHQVTTVAVEALVTKLDMNAVDIERGAAVIVFGWAAFALATLAAMFVGALVAIEPPMERSRLERMYGMNLREEERLEELALKKMNSAATSARRMRKREEEEMRELDRQEERLHKLQMKEQERSFKEEKRMLKAMEKDELLRAKSVRRLQEREHHQEEEEGRMLLAASKHHHQQALAKPPAARLSFTNRLMNRGHGFRRSMGAAVGSRGLHGVKTPAAHHADTLYRSNTVTTKKSSPGLLTRGYHAAEMVHRGDQLYNLAQNHLPSTTQDPTQQSQQQQQQSPDEPYIRGVLHMGPTADRTVFYADPNATLKKSYKPPRGVQQYEGVHFSPNRWNESEHRLNGGYI